MGKGSKGKGSGKENGNRDVEGRAKEKSSSWKTGIYGVSGLTPDFLLSSEPLVNSYRTQSHMSEALDSMVVLLNHFFLFLQK